MTVLSSTPLSADAIKVRAKEPYVTSALNQKTLSTQPKGVMTGFGVIPSGLFAGFGVRLTTDATGLSAANVRETTGGLFSVTLVLNSFVDLDLTAQAGQTVFIALDAQYAVGATSAAQVKVVDAAEIGLTGVGDSFSGAAPNMVLTDAAALFTANMVGSYVTITGATSPANNGTFLITAYGAPSNITFTNPSGVVEAFTGTWNIVVNKDLVLLAKVNVPGVAPILTSHINLGWRDASGDFLPVEYSSHINLVHNSSFEATAAGWTNNGFDSVTASTDYAYSGGYSLKLVKAVAGTVNAVTGPMPVVPGRNYRVKAWLRSPAGITGGNGAKLQVAFYDAAGAQIGAWADVEAAIGSGTMAFFVERRIEAIAPVLALNAQIRVLFDNCSGTLYMDSPEFATHAHDEMMKSAVFGGPGVSADGYHTHTGAGLAYGGGVAWADTTPNPATTVEAQLDKILSDLAGASGAPKIGNAPSKILANIFTNHNDFTNTAAPNTSAITATGNGSGAGLVGISGNVGTGNNAGLRGVGVAIGSGTGGTIGVYAEGGAALSLGPSGTGLVAVGGDGVSTDVVGGIGIVAFGGDGGSGGNDGGVGISATGGDGGGGNDGAAGGVFTGGTGTNGGAGGVFTGGAPNGVGGVFSGVGGAAAIDATGDRIVNVADPTAAQDAATRAYVDANAGTALNAVINGGVEIWQRGNLVTSNIIVGASVAGYNFHGYCADRWYAQTRDDGAPQAIAVDIRPFTVTGLADTRRAIRIRNMTPGASGQFYQVVQEIDRDTVVRLRGKKVSWRVAVRKGSSSSFVTDFFCELYSNTGAASQRLAAYSGGAGVGASSLSGGALSTVNFTYVTGTSAAVIPAGANGMSILVGAYHNGIGPADANDYLEFGEFSIVSGETPPTKFTWAGGDLNTELNMCERYYEKSYPFLIAPATGLATTGFEKFENNNLPAQLLPGVRFKVRKRATPAIVFYTPATGTAGSWDETLSPGAYPITANGIADTGFYATQASIGVGGNWQGHWVADAEI